MKEKLLNEVINFYLGSSSFNGLPIYDIDDYDIEAMVELINEGMVEAISEKDVLNPHIKGFELGLSKKHQIENAKDVDSHTCFYPTDKALEKVKVDYQRPYTALMRNGKAQFDIIFFDVEILERYNNNPRFLIMDNGYRGCISVKDEFFEESGENEYIKDYGMAYIDGEKLNRAIGVFVIDLAKLSPRIQMLWKGFELEDQDSCKINDGFVKNLLEGRWVTQHWIFHALLDEMKVINEQCKKMELPELFAHVYGTGYNEMPEGYRSILLPTLKNYYDFVLVMEKLVVHNISIKTFQKDSLLIAKIERKDGDGKDKGSIVMLQEWLKRNVSSNFDIDEVIINPIKYIRKIRQVPAHELTNNKYDIDVYEKQKELMVNTYGAIRAIRILFMGHPLAKDVKIPEYLLQGKDIVFY